MARASTRQPPVDEPPSRRRGGEAGKHTPGLTSHCRSRWALVLALGMAAEPPKPSRLSPTTPLILSAGVLVVVGLLGMSHRSAVRSERAMGAINAAQKLLLSHAALRARVGPIVASGSFSMECTDVLAQGWFRTAVMGGEAPSAGRAHLTASRPRGGWASLLGLGQERPWAVDALRLEVDTEGLDARAAARRAVAVKAGYAAAEEGAQPGGSAARAALLDMGGEATAEGLINLELVKAQQ
jgi:hypothetical protein